VKNIRSLFALLLLSHAGQTYVMDTETPDLEAGLGGIPQAWQPDAQNEEILRLLREHRTTLDNLNAMQTRRINRLETKLATIHEDLHLMPRTRWVGPFLISILSFTMGAWILCMAHAFES